MDCEYICQIRSISEYSLTNGLGKVSQHHCSRAGNPTCLLFMSPGPIVFLVTVILDLLVRGLVVR